MFFPLDVEVVFVIPVKISFNYLLDNILVLLLAQLGLLLARLGLGGLDRHGRMQTNRKNIAFLWKEKMVE